MALQCDSSSSIPVYFCTQMHFADFGNTFTHICLTRSAQMGHHRIRGREVHHNTKGTAWARELTTWHNTWLSDETEYLVGALTGCHVGFNGLPWTFVFSIPVQKILVLKCAIRENGATDHKDLKRLSHRYTNTWHFSNKKCWSHQTHRCSAAFFGWVRERGGFNTRCWALNQS
jgi:hypothetical protein